MDTDETLIKNNLESVKPSHDLCSAEGYAMIWATFEVHKTIGGGLLEEIYQEALAHEFGIRRIPHHSRPLIEVKYKNFVLNKRYIPDFLVNERIVVELKAVSAIAPEHEAQLLNYMRISRMAVGYLINFAPVSKVEWKRFVLSEFL